MNKVWLPEKYKGKNSARVDDVVVPYGKENAVSVTNSQLDRLKATGSPIQFETGSGSGSFSGSKSDEEKTNPNQENPDQGNSND